MGNMKVNSFLLTTSGLLLLLGFVNKNFWALAAIISLFPAFIWVVKDLQNRTVGSDFLAILSLCGTLLTEEFFAGAVIALMLASGRVLENWAEGQAERQLKSLLARIPRTVHRIKNGGELEEIDIDQIQVRDRLLVRAGEILAADGELLGPATLDEAALTGEPLPVNRLAGDQILSGVVNAANPFEYMATNIAADSTYAGIIELVKAAQARTSPGVRIAGKWAMVFVPFALIVAGLAWLISGDATRAVAVLVAATPCPLILAVPIAVVAGLSNAAKHGAVIKGGAILEALARVETVLLDKTGTITHGGPVIAEIVFSEGFSEADILNLAASVDVFSQNIIGKSLVKSARDLELRLQKVDSVAEVAGHHISGVINGATIYVGQLNEVRPQWLKLNYPLIVAVKRNGELIGAIGLTDPIRPESKNLVSALRATGVKNIALVTGDSDETAQAVAKEVGITQIYSQVSAAEKLAITQAAIRAASGTVVVVGDGINDAPALAAADIGVAMAARGASAASEAADIVIVEDSIDRLTVAIAIAKRSRKKAMQSAGIGMFLSTCIMATGAFGLTSASAGAFAQELIDVIAIVWALTTLKQK